MSLMLHECSRDVVKFSFERLMHALVFEYSSSIVTNDDDVRFHVSPLSQIITSTTHFAIRRMLISQFLYLFNQTTTLVLTLFVTYESRTSLCL